MNKSNIAAACLKRVSRNPATPIANDKGNHIGNIFGLAQTMKGRSLSRSFGIIPRTTKHFSVGRVTRIAYALTTLLQRKYREKFDVLVLLIQQMWFNRGTLIAGSCAYLPLG